MIAQGDAAKSVVVGVETSSSSAGRAVVSSSLVSTSSAAGRDSPAKAEGEEWGLELPEDFVPSKMDVIVGWARQNYHHGT